MVLTRVRSADKRPTCQQDSPRALGCSLEKREHGTMGECKHGGNNGDPEAGAAMDGGTQMDKWVTLGDLGARGTQGQREPWNKTWNPSRKVPRSEGPRGI